MRKKYTYRKQNNNPDRRLIALTLILTVVGLVAVADASAPSALTHFGDKYYFVKQQAVWAFVAVCSFFVVSKIPYQFWSRIAVPAFGASLVGLFLVLIPAFAPSLLGARRWIVIGGFTFQPSEFVKITLALYLAKVAESKKELIAYLVPIGFVAFMVMLEPDLGTTIVLVIIGLTQLYLSGVEVIHLAVVSIFAGLAGSSLIFLSDYRRARLITFLEQTQDPLGKGYHIRQILLALGSGGAWGVGLGRSRQKYSFIPEAATDSIFAVIAEEIGFFGSVLFIILLSAFIIQGLRVVRAAPDRFSKILSAGLVAWIGGQILVNLAAMVSLIPLTGIPLPFISYGGSSLTTVLVAAGILVNISSYARK